MAKFKYKFESIKRIKESLEKKAQKEVAVIDLDIQKKNEECEKIMTKEKESKINFKQKTVSAGEMQFIKNYELFLQKKRAEIQKDIEILKTKREIKMSELVQKSKEHKIFNKLEEKHIENFYKEQDHLELGFIDELATQKFVRRKK